MNKVKLIIFDYDGVIVDSLDIWIDVLKEMGNRYNAGKELGHKDLAEMKQITLNGIMDIVAIPQGKREKYLSDVFRSLSERALSMVLFENVDILIRELHKNDFIICINTANNSKAILKKLEKTNLNQYISYITGGDHCQIKSENIDFLRKKYNIEVENTFMIGDSLNDITEGKKAGVKTVAVTYGWQSLDTLSRSNPDFICSSVKDLQNLLCILES